MPDHRYKSRLSTPNFLRGELRAQETFALNHTFGGHRWVEASPHRWHEAGTERLVQDVTGVIGDGKEATVYQCQTDEHLDFRWAVAKVYRAQKFRAFSNARQYLDGRELRDRRERRAVKNKTKRGRQIAHRHWIEREWETANLLYDAGADVPEPFAHSSDSILMEYVGDEAGPAPLLLRTELTQGELQTALEGVLANVEIFLACDRVHGDLSAYNVLWWEGAIKVIDLPQAVAASSPDAQRLLDRDVRNVAAWFMKAGLRLDPGAIAHDLWRRYMRGLL